MVSVLRGYPDVAATVGYYFAEFGGLEWDLRFAFDHLFQGREELSEAFFRPREAISSRVEAMFKFAKALAPDSPISRCFMDIESEVFEVIQFRNTLAHGRFGLFPDERGLCVTLGRRQHKLTEDFMSDQLAKVEAIKTKSDFAWHQQRALHALSTSAT